MKSSGVVASGQTRARPSELEMSRSCQSAWFSSAADRVAAHHAREPADVLEAPGVALVRHRGGALLARCRSTPRPRPPRCARGGAARPRLRRARREQRERDDQLGVAVALHDLRRDRLEAEAEPRAARPPRPRRVEVREGADRARDLADRGLARARARGAPRSRRSSCVEAPAASARRWWARRGCRACGRRTAVRRCSSARRAAASSTRSRSRSRIAPRVAELERERGVEHVARGDARGARSAPRGRRARPARRGRRSRRGAPRPRSRRSRAASNAARSLDRAQRLARDLAALGEHAADRDLDRRARARSGRSSDQIAAISGRV